MEELIEKLFCLIEGVAASSALTEEEEIKLDELYKEYYKIKEEYLIF